MRNLIATPLVAGAALIASAAGAHASPGAPPATTDGSVRLANLSPSAGTCDLYLYSFGNPRALLVLRNVNYGRVSTYTALPAGDYTVAMRMSGQPEAAPAVATTALMLMGNMQYTVAAMGSGNHKQFQTIVDGGNVAAGQTAVRVLQAASTTTVSADIGQRQVGSDLKFGDITHYQTVAAGTQQLTLTTSAGPARTALQLSPNSTHTIVVLEGSRGPLITELTDAAGTTVRPSGGAATGLGGTAPQPASSPLPWLAMIGGGIIAAVLGCWRRITARASR